MKTHDLHALMDLFLRTDDLDKIVEESSLVLKNPLLICDTSYYFLSNSPISEVKDMSWCLGIRRGKWTAETANIISQCDLDYTGTTHKTAVLTNICDISSKRRMVGTLCFEQTHLGYYLILEENTPLEEIDDNIYQTVEMIISKCVCHRHTITFFEKIDLTEDAIFSLLHNPYNDKKEFLEKYKNSGFSLDSTYRIICADIIDYFDLKKNTNQGINKKLAGIKSSVGQIFPHSKLVYYQNYLVILVENTITNNGYDIAHSAEGAFDEYLSSLDACAGISDCFSDISRFRYYYEQAKSAISVGKSLRKKNRIFYYDRYKLFDLFHNLNCPELFERYSTEVIREIAKYDTDNKTEYMNTVYRYLENGCSVKKTAADLYVHRNTVVYRISKLQELFPITFENNATNFLNYISCLMYRNTFPERLC